MGLTYSRIRPTHENVPHDNEVLPRPPTVERNQSALKAVGAALLLWVGVTLLWLVGLGAWDHAIPLVLLVGSLAIITYFTSWLSALIFRKTDCHARIVYLSGFAGAALGFLWLARFGWPVSEEWAPLYWAGGVLYAQVPAVLLATLVVRRRPPAKSDG